jgi:hypothetical protein
MEWTYKIYIHDFNVLKISPNVKYVWANGLARTLTQHTSEIQGQNKFSFMYVVQQRFLSRRYITHKTNNPRKILYYMVILLGFLLNTMITCMFLIWWVRDPVTLGESFNCHCIWILPLRMMRSCHARRIIQVLAKEDMWKYLLDN